MFPITLPRLPVCKKVIYFCNVSNLHTITFSLFYPFLTFSPSFSHFSSILLSFSSNSPLSLFRFLTFFYCLCSFLLLFPFFLPSSLLGRIDGIYPPAPAARASRRVLIVIVITPSRKIYGRHVDPFDAAMLATYNIRVGTAAPATAPCHPLGRHRCHLC